MGRGSTGVVWAATCRESGERVALKVLEPEVDAVDLDDVDREEALGRRASGSHVLGVRSRITLDDGRVALVMGLADGGSLRDVVTIRGALPLGEVVTALTPLATALAELHETGVVHVDVSPGNVLFTPDGRPMLVDLSSAWLVDDGWPQRSLGTSGFAAPEVVLGRPPVPASDVWSLGAVAWYARTGGSTPPPWVGDLHWARGLAGARTGDPDEEGLESGTVADVMTAVGPELTPLLVRMLADEPEARPAAAEVALALYRTAAPEPVGLVGHHPDPAAAVTTRIRREAAETRSRTELRDAERAAHRRERRELRHRRARAWLVPWAKATGSSATTGPSGESSWRSRLVVVGLVGLVLAGGMLALLHLTGGPLEVATTSVADTSPSTSESLSSGASMSSTADSSSAATSSAVDPSAGPSAPLAGGQSGPSNGSAAGAANDPAHQAGGGGRTNTATGGPLGTAAADHVGTAAGDHVGTAAGDHVGSPATMAGTPTGGGMASSDNVVRDPVAALQRLADVRSTALMAADPVVLASAEPTGSSAYENDVRTVTRLREQGQRYAELSFTVRSAKVVTVGPTTVVLQAVVDRSAYLVVGAGGAGAGTVGTGATAAGGGGSQSIGPGPGVPLRYTLSATDGAWRLTEVGPP